MASLFDKVLEETYKASHQGIISRIPSERDVVFLDVHRETEKTPTSPVLPLYSIQRKESENSIAILYTNHYKNNIHAAVVVKPIDKHLGKLDTFHLARNVHEVRDDGDIIATEIRENFYESVILSASKILQRLLETHPQASLFFVESERSDFNKRVTERVPQTFTLINKRKIKDLVDAYNQFANKNNFLDNLLIEDKSNRRELVKIILNQFFIDASRNPLLQNQTISLQSLSKELVKTYRDNPNIINVANYHASDIGILTYKDRVQEYLRPSGIFNVPPSNAPVVIVLDDNINTMKTFDEINLQIKKTNPSARIFWVVGVIPQIILSKHK